MLECLILGDSLAVGVGQVRTECVTFAKSGINSYDYVNRHLLHTNGNNQAKSIIISLGSNDTQNINTFEELNTLRQLVKADRVYWILPAIKEEKRKAEAEKYEIAHQIEASGMDKKNPANYGIGELAIPNPPAPQANIAYGNISLLNSAGSHARAYFPA